MGGANGYAAMVAARKAKPKGKRRRFDNYETPSQHTFQLTDVATFKGPILEPACGSGRMVRALRSATGLKVTGFDFRDGNDFLARKKPWPGDIVTNPPYGNGAADAFVNHALALADGRVAMLMELKYLTGDKRAAKVFRACPPDLIVIIPERIYFYAGRDPIKAQFYNHVWIVWPDRKARKRGGYQTRTIWASPQTDFG
jgi:hypothetical protein